ncbi:MAG TPA: alpha/beta fold hydrolase, partial [Anaerolineales bacterium]
MFINSLGTTLHMWDASITSLADERLCLRYDKRGHGGSRNADGPYSIEQFSADLNQLLTGLDILPRVVIGISIGGLIAMDYALRYGAELDGLILANTAAQIGSPEGWQQRIEAVQRRGLKAMVTEIVPHWFAEGLLHSHPNRYQYYASMLAAQSVA